MDEQKWTDFPVRLDVEGEEINRLSHNHKFAISSKDQRIGKKLYKLNAVLGNKIVFTTYSFLRMVYRIIRRKPLKDKQEVMYG